MKQNTGPLGAHETEHIISQQIKGVYPIAGVFYDRAHYAAEVGAVPEGAPIIPISCGLWKPCWIEL